MKAFNLDAIGMCADWRRLQFLGHQMRLPLERIDRSILWLHPEEEFVTARNIGGGRLRIRCATRRTILRAPAGIQQGAF
eukprot:2559365-Pyramimonas_sp.AAC.1